MFRHRASVSPIPQSGLSLWLKADAGVTTTTVVSLLHQLLAYWKLDNNSWLDSSGNGYALSYETSNPTIGTGIINGDAIFDGNGLYNYPITQRSTISCSIWVKAVENDSGEYQAIVGNWDFDRGNGDGLSWVVNIDPTGHALITTAHWSDQTVGSITSSSTLQVGWNHICVTISPAFNAIYLNGVATTGSLPTMDLINNIIQVGFQSRDGLYFNGEIDEVGIWNKLLSQSDVIALYNAGAGKTYPFVGTSLMDVVTAWADQSGNGKNATSVVNPAYTASAKNGKPAITFFGADMMTTANIFNGSNPRTMFAVYYIDNDSTANTICGQTNDIEVIDGSFFLLQARSDFTNPYLATANDDLSGTNFTNQVWKIAMADYNGTTANLYDNGGNVGTNVFSWNTHNGTFCIGAYFTNDNIGSLQELLVGKIAEIVVYDRVLTTPERQQVETYLNTKYAIY
jgi:hypothetical protein